MNGELVRDRRFMSVTLVAALLAVAYLAVNLFRLGGDGTVFLINTYVEPLFAIANAVICIWLWTRTSKKNITRKIWGYFALGMGIWGCAEILWAVYALGLINEPPYPSLADIFYFIGYLPLFISLLTRYRTLRVRLTAKQGRTVILVAMPVVAVVAYFILYPIIQDFSSERFIEAFLNLFYPLADLGVLLIALFILYIISEGKVSLAWKVITSGLALMSFADLLFTYATWNGLYYPDGHVNWISILVDYPYNTSYLIIALGVCLYWIIDERQKAKAILVEPTVSRPVNCDILLFTDKQNNLISFSNNLLRLVKAIDRMQLMGRPLTNIFGPDDHDVEAVLKEIADAGYVHDRQIKITDQLGQTHTIWVSALAVRSTDRLYDGANIVFQAFVEGKIENDLSVESQLLVKNMLSKAGVINRENRQIIKKYFGAQVEVVFDLVRELSGGKTSRAMTSLLNDISNQNGWAIEFNLPEILVPDGIDNKKLAEACLIFLKNAKTFASDIVDSAIVRDEMDKVDRRLSEADLRIIDSFGLRNLQ